MKILSLQGSPRKEGNTAKVLSWVEEALIALNHEVESIFLNTKNLKGCLACGKCKEKPDTVGCIQKDDIPEILEKSTLLLFKGPDSATIQG